MPVLTLPAQLSSVSSPQKDVPAKPPSQDSFSAESYKGCGAQAVIYSSKFHDKPCALKVFENDVLDTQKSKFKLCFGQQTSDPIMRTPMEEFQLLQKLHAQCPNYILKPLGITCDATVTVPNNLPSSEDDLTLAQYRTGTSTRNNVQCIAMELCECDSFSLLEQFQTEGQPMCFTDKEMLVGLFRQICTAVGAMHSSGFCHLDLKLENILIGQDYNIRLCDFGFAQPTEEHLMSKVGTQMYMAPEMFDQGKLFSESGISGKLCDIYSLGVILYTLAFGKPPFQMANVQDKFWKIRLDKPDKLFRLHPNTKQLLRSNMIDAELQDLLLRLLAPDQERLKSVNEILQHSYIKQENGSQGLNGAKIQKIQGLVSQIKDQKVQN